MIDAFKNNGYSTIPADLSFIKLASVKNCLVGDTLEAGFLAKELALLPAKLLEEAEKVNTEQVWDSRTVAMHLC